MRRLITALLTHWHRVNWLYFEAVVLYPQGVLWMGRIFRTMWSVLWPGGRDVKSCYQSENHWKQTAVRFWYVHDWQTSVRPVNRYHYFVNCHLLSLRSVFFVLSLFRCYVYVIENQDNEYQADEIDCQKNDYTDDIVHARNSGLFAFIHTRVFSRKNFQFCK